MTERTDMIDKANELGLSFAGNISNIKLRALLDTAAGESDTSAPTTSAPTKDGKQLSRRQRIAAAKKAAFETKIVTITNRDTRDAEFTTTVNLSFENNHFGIGRIVPLDIPVQIEVALIHIAATTLMTLHKDEIIDGKRTGNKVATRVKKYAISYGENQ